MLPAIRQLCYSNLFMIRGAVSMYTVLPYVSGASDCHSTPDSTSLAFLHDSTVVQASTFPGQIVYFAVVPFLHELAVRLEIYTIKLQ